MKNVGLGEVVTHKWDHLDIKTTSAGPTGGRNFEVPLYSRKSTLDILRSFNIQVILSFNPSNINKSYQSPNMDQYVACFGHFAAVVSQILPYKKKKKALDTPEGTTISEL